MKHSIRALTSLVVLGQVLSVLADDAVECYIMGAIDNQIESTYNSQGLCASHCEEAGYSIWAARGSYCSCANTLPPSTYKKADASQCDEPCPGYAADTCGGGREYYSVGTVSGLDISSSSAASSSASTSGTTTTSTVSDGTESVTSQTSPAAAATSSSSTPSNTTATATSSSTSGSSGTSGSASPQATIETSSAGAPIFEKGGIVVASVVSAVAAFVALI